MIVKSKLGISRARRNMLRKLNGIGCGDRQRKIIFAAANSFYANGCSEVQPILWNLNFRFSKRPVEPRIVIERTGLEEIDGEAAPKEGVPIPGLKFELILTVGEPT